MKILALFRTHCRYTDILMLTGSSKASELAKEKGSMIHLSRDFAGKVEELEAHRLHFKVIRARFPTCVHVGWLPATFP